MIIISCVFKIIAIFDFGFNMYDLKDVDIGKCVNNKWFVLRCVLSIVMMVILFLVVKQDISLFNAYFKEDSDTLFLNTKLNDNLDVK